MTKCVRPEAPVVKCCVCEKEVKTCERDVAINGNYVCPVHPEGAELSHGRWVCSDQCWDTATAEPPAK